MKSKKSNPFRSTLATTIFCGVLISHFAITSASAIDRYWDTNTTTAGFGAITGAWNGTNAFWNTLSTGNSGGTFVASPTSADDLFVSAGTANGTITVTGTQAASSITLSAPFTRTISGGTSITIGGTGTNSGLFSSGASTTTISTPIILNSASTAVTVRSTNTAQTFTIGKITGGATTGTQTISVEANGGAVALNGGVLDSPAGGKVAINYSGTAGGTTVTGTSSYSGGTVVNSTGTGILAVASNTGFGTGSVTINGGNIRGSTSGTTLSNAITLGGNFTASTLTGEKTLTLSGPITLTGNRTITANLGTTVATEALVLSNAIGDGGNGFGLTQNGTGKLTLTGSSTYTGTTVVSAGTLTLGNATNTILNTAPVTVSGGVLNVANPDTVGAITITGGTISGAATLTGSSYDLQGGTVTAPLGGGVAVGKSTSGVANLGGTQVYTDATNVTAGTLNVTGTLGNTLLTVSNGAKLGGEGSSAGNVVFNAGSGVVFDPSTTGANQYFRTSGNIDTTAGAGTKINIDLTAPTTNTGVVVFEAGSITTNGLSDFKLNARGTLSLSATQLLFDFSAGSVVWKGANGTNPAFWDVNTTAQNWTLGGVDDFFLNGDNVLFDDSAANFNPAVQSALAAGTVTFDNALVNPYSLSGAGVTGSSLTKTGTGKVTLSNAITLSGGTTISNGTLQLGDGTNATGSVTGAITNNAALITNFGANNVTIANAISGTGSLTQSGAGTVILTAANSYGATTIDTGATLQIGTGGAAGTIGTGAITNNGTLIFNRDNSSNITLASVISGSGSLTKQGSGAMILSSANPYTGATTITHTVASGAVIVTVDGALGTNAAGTTVVTGTTLGLSGGIDYATTELVSGSGGGSAVITGAIAVGTRGFIQSTSGNNTFRGNIELNANGVSRIGTQNGASLTLTGTITQGSGITTGSLLFRSGDSSGDFITLSNAANSFGGDSTIFNGAASGVYAGVRLGVTNALPTNWTITGFASAGNGASLDLAGYDQTLNGLISSGTGALKIVNLNTVTPSTLTLNPTVAKSSPTTILGGTGLGVINLVKSGTFTQTLTGVNTYTGATTVNGGTLTLGASGSVSSSASLIIGAGAKLNTTAQASFALSGSQPVTFKLDSAGAGSSGQIDAAGLNITSAAVTFTITGTLDDAAYVLATYTSKTGAAFASVTPPTGYTLDYAYNGGTQIALVQSGYASWIGGFPGLADITEGGDPDSDGMKNVLEYVLNGNPGASDPSILPTLNASGANFVFNFTRRTDSANDTTQVFEYSTNLGTWTPVNITGTPGSEVAFGAASGGVQTVTVTIPKGTETKLFGRLKVSK